MFCFVLNTKGDFGQVSPVGFCLTLRSFMTLFDDAFEASETQDPLKRNQQNKLDRYHILNVFWSFSRCSRWLWGHWGWRDHSSIRSRWGSKVRCSDGASHPWHWTISRMLLWTSPSSHQSTDISDPAKMHKHNTKTVILTAQCHLLFLY